MQMLIQTLTKLACPKRVSSSSCCAGELFLFENTQSKGDDVFFGTIICKKCESTFPILAGVAVLVEDVEFYLLNHVKGISALVKDEEIPAQYREAFVQAKSEIESEHIEEDLESNRINALYFMNHYLTVKKSKNGLWWKPKKGAFSKEIDQLVRKHWDTGPFHVISKWTAQLKKQNTIELGCGVGGLASHLKKSTASYLGVDSSFASIALARHIHLKTSYPLEIKIPQDLIEGALTKKVSAEKPTLKATSVDFVVGELQSLPAIDNHFDLSIALNAIDMLEDPTVLPKIQNSLLKVGGVAIQSCPYIWHEAIAKNIRKLISKKTHSSSQAVEFLYEKANLKILKRIEHQPWLFFKHFRQIELYSVHIFLAKKLM